MSDKENGANGQREKIAIWITIITLSGTVLLGIVGIILVFQVEENRMQSLQYIFGALLPLWGTWIGTILAYYFSKENFESANKNVRELVGQVTTVSDKLKSIKATQVMIPLADIGKHGVSASEDVDSIKVKDLVHQLNVELKRQRLPIMTKEKNILKYILHSSVFDRYIRTKSLAEEPWKEDTIKTMKETGDKEVQNYLANGAAFISKDQTLLDAKRIMDKNVYCNDVFITETGHSGESVIGWISDKIINENAKV